MIRTIQNILVPVNFSESTDNAVKTGVAMCKRHGAVLHLLHVKEQTQNVFPPGKKGALLGMMLEAHMDNLDRLESEANRIMEENNIVCFYHSESGSFHQVVASKVDDLHCDLVILEKEKSIFPFGFLKANNIYKTLRHAACAVLTVPADEKYLDFKEVLFPVRPVRAGLDELGLAIRILEKNSSHVLLLRLVQPSMKEAEHETVDNLVTRADEEISRANVRVDTEVGKVGDMALQVVKKALEKQSDLIVITDTVKKGLRSLFFRNYAERVISASPVPVLSVKVSE